MQAILFDFWGTLVDNGLEPSPVRQVRYILDIEVPFKEYIVRFEDVFMTADYDDLYDAFEAVCDEFKIYPDDDIVEEAVDMWQRNDRLAEPYDDTETMLEEFSDDYVIGLISNSPPTIRDVLEKFDLTEKFDAITLSYEEGMLKTDPRLFETALDRLSVEKEAAVMVGDSIHTDMEGAKQAGVNAVLADRRDTRDYEPKIETLEELYDYI
jgi:HAD superfamily hydrolase (TIGR01549 family)